MGLFLTIPRLLLSVLKSPVNDIRKYIISSIINIVIKNNNIQDIIKTTQPLILVKMNFGIIIMPIAMIVAKLLRIIMKLVLKEHVLQLWKLIK